MIKKFIFSLILIYGANAFSMNADSLDFEPEYGLFDMELDGQSRLDCDEMDCTENIQNYTPIISQSLQSSDFATLATTILEIYKKIQANKSEDIDLKSTLFVYLLTNKYLWGKEDLIDITDNPHILKSYTNMQQYYDISCKLIDMHKGMKPQEIVYMPQEIAEELHAELLDENLITELIHTFNFSLLKIFYEMNLVAKDEIKQSIRFYYIELFEVFLHLLNKINIGEELLNKITNSITKNIFHNVPVDYTEILKLILKEASASVDAKESKIISPIQHQLIQLNYTSNLLSKCN